MDEAILLVSEIVSNSVRHAGLDDRDAIEVYVRGDGRGGPRGRVRPRPGFDIEQLPAPSGDGGWGLWLLARLSSRWGRVERGDMTRVWFELASPVRPSGPGT